MGRAKLRARLLFGLVGIFCLAVAACAPEEDPEVPTRLSVGVLPDQNEAMLRARYEPFLAYLSDTLDIEFELTIPESYAQLLEMFGEGQVDMAYFGAVTFVEAAQEFGAALIAMREVDSHFTTYFLARTDRPEQDIEAFEGKTFTFGSRLSTSGHIMPRYFLRQMGIEPEDHFATVRYSGAHDRSVLSVQDGEVDLAAANALIVEGLFRDGRLDAGKVRVVWETPPYPDYVWAVQGSLGQEVKTRLRDAFLALSSADARQAAVLDALQARGFLPAAAGDFSTIAEAMAQVADRTASE